MPEARSLGKYHVSLQSNFNPPPLPHPHSECSMSQKCLAACNVSQGHYRFITDLLALENCHPISSRCCLPTNISTPLKCDIWAHYLSTHPDKEFVSYILQGINNGFHIGFDRKSSELQQAKGNISSTRLNPRAVDGYVEAKKHEGRLVGPIPPELHNHCQLSPIGLIPKKHRLDAGAS